MVRRGAWPCRAARAGRRQCALARRGRAAMAIGAGQLHPATPGPGSGRRLMSCPAASPVEDIGQRQQRTSRNRPSHLVQRALHQQSADAHQDKARKAQPQWAPPSMDAPSLEQREQAGRRGQRQHNAMKGFAGIDPACKSGEQGEEQGQAKAVQGAERGGAKRKTIQPLVCRLLPACRWLIFVKGNHHRSKMI